MEKDSKHKLTELAVDGGMSNSDLCMQVCRLFPTSSSPFLLPSTNHLRLTDTSKHNRHPRRAPAHARNHRPRRRHRGRLRSRRLGDLRRAENHQHHGEDGVYTEDRTRGEGSDVWEVEQGGGDV
jgi:hypothetical protein